MDHHKLFEVSQNIAIQNAANRILIVEKDGKWMLPGGRLEENETWLEGLRREVREETTIKNFSVAKVLRVYTSDSGKTYGVIFLGKLEGNPEITLSSEHQKYVWLDSEDIDAYEFWHEGIKQSLTSAFREE